MIRRSILLFIFITVSGLLNAQLVFNSLPLQYHFFVRDSAAWGRFSFSGQNASAQSFYLKSRLVEANDHEAVIEEKIMHLSPQQHFHIAHLIPSQLKEYDLMIIVNNSRGDSLATRVQHLLCGDMFMICGQSNALAASPPGDTSNLRPWLRGIGKNDDALEPAFPCEPQQLSFSPANPSWDQPGFVGTWGMKLACDLAYHTHIPLCVINGARAGSSILQNLASHTPSDARYLDSCNGYDRAYLRAAHNKLTSNLRAMFWYQGETDGGFTSPDSVCNYIKRFHELYTSWKVDYPKLEKIFLLQVNTGCTDKNLGLLREIQRQIAYRYSDVVLMSTFSTDTADRLNDACHYTGPGYKKLAERLVPLMQKYIYKEGLSEDSILPPKIVKAYVSKPAQLCLEFDKPVQVETEKQYRYGTAYIKDYFYGPEQSELHINSVTYEGNQVYLNFAEGELLPALIGYVPAAFSKIPSLYTGPWILNAKNTGLPAISFYDFPVTSDDNSNNWTAASSNGACGHYIPPVPSDKGFLSYPSPAHDIITVTFPKTLIHENTITLIDAYGHIIRQSKSYYNFSVEIDVSTLNPGLYFIKVDNAKGSYIRKTMIE